MKTDIKTRGIGSRRCRSLARIGLTCSLMLCLIAGAGGCRQDKAAKAAEPPPSRLVFPDHGIYTGAYIDFGDNEDAVTLDAIEDFEKLVGRHQAIVASSSFWGEQNFPRKSMEIISRHGSVPLLYWSPWDRPYVQGRGPDRFSLKAILAGRWDAYIDQWADQARQYGKPILVAWGLEMNGTWFPWSGHFYGGGRRLDHEAPKLYEGPELYKKAFRYVVQRVRARGADRLLFGYHANNMSIPYERWNRIWAYYPGSDVVDWLGLSVYGKQFNDGERWGTFHGVMDAAYRDLCRLDPDKPVILAEWGVGEFPKAGNKPQWLRDAFTAFADQYPRIKGAVYWHERWQNEDDTYSNLRVNSSPESLQVFREGLAHPYWVTQPLYR
ncbi:MAG: beta-mannanase [Syntrophobacteraceae bacterium CG07_land_8_20_14_0_80_61_8]|nr:MAG: beta-mannanase [Syntrophobacteraceae bacterium CG07_land_8_20_14_0_80_61_8]